MKNGSISLYGLSLILLQVSCMKMGPDEKALNNFRSKVILEIERDYGLNCYGAGSSMPDKIEEINLVFKGEYSEYLEGARRLAVPIALRMVNEMNRDKNLIPHLADYPATIKNICLTIGFRQENEENYNQNNCLDSVMVIGMKGRILYNIYNEGKTRLIDLHRESFEEAQIILEREGSLQVEGKESPFQ